MQSYKDLNLIYQGGMLSISGRFLDSLEGCPQQVTGSFLANNNQLTSLSGGPSIVADDYFCSSNILTDLVGCASHIPGEFYCNNNRLTSLVGGPQTVDGEYQCSDTLITDLVGCASHIGGSLTSWNSIKSLVGIHKIIKRCSRMLFDVDQIKQGGIGLLMIANLSVISDHNEPFEIISTYLGTGTKGMMECSKVLTSMGYGNYAKL